MLSGGRPHAVLDTSSPAVTALRCCSLACLRLSISLTTGARAGRTFADARRQFRFATLCGIVPCGAGSSGDAGDASDSAGASSTDSESEAAATTRGAAASGPATAAAAASAAASSPAGYTAPFNFNLRNVLGLPSNGANSSSNNNSSSTSGYQDGGGGGRSGLVMFAPPDDRVLRRHDQLVLLGNKQKDCFASLLNHLVGAGVATRMWEHR